MESKDTVILFSGNKQSIELYLDALLLEQAEISFKAGFDFGLSIAFSKADYYKAGRKEVVEWIERTKDTAYICDGGYTYDTKCDNELFIDLGDWQAKLKEWRIE